MSDLARSSNTAGVVVVAGGYRTGSTLQYNLLGSYLEFTSQGKRIGLVDPDDIGPVLMPALADGDGLLVAKCHHIAAGFGRFRNETAWRDLVEAGVAVAISTWRNEADVRQSMCRKFGIRPGELDSSTTWLVDRANTLEWQSLEPLCQGYDDLTMRPLDALAELINHLDLEWDSVGAHRAISASSLEAVSRVISGLEEDTWDPLTLVHWNHLSPTTVRDLTTRRQGE